MDNKEQQVGKELKSYAMKIKNYFMSQKLLDPNEKSWRKDIVSSKTGISMDIINELIDKKILFEIEQGRITDIPVRSRIGNEQRQKLIKSLAYPVKEQPRRSYAPSKLVRDLEEKNRGFSK